MTTASTDPATCHPGSPSPGHLCMPEDARKRAARRLKIARGHLDSIVAMLEKEDAYCVDVLRQIKAVQGALSGAGEVV
ncbi:MAG: metal-sensing transcriptional repressor, partial [Deinococcota bacterium]